MLITFDPALELLLYRLRTSEEEVFDDYWAARIQANGALCCRIDAIRSTLFLVSPAFVQTVVVADFGIGQDYPLVKTKFLLV